jgi:hypothetical protein
MLNRGRVVLNLSRSHIGDLSLLTTNATTCKNQETNASDTLAMSSPSSLPTESSASSVDSVSGFVDLYALSAGQFTLPEEQFVSDATSAERKTVPSLSFLIQHTCQATRRSTRIVFDLGLRRDINRYSAPIQEHIKTRQPLSTDPDVTKSLARGGLSPDDIDYVIYSHVRLSRPRNH